MFSLALATLCSAMIALIFKYSESHDQNRLAVTSTNYLAATLVSLFMLLGGAASTGGLRFNLGTWLQELRPVFVQGSGSFSTTASMTWAILLGAVTGVFYFLGFIYYQASVRQNGAGLSGAFGKMGILLPMLLSLFIWRELPGAWQWVGISLALASMVLVYLPSGSSESGHSWRASLLLLFLFSGTGEFAGKLFQKYALPSDRSLYLLLIFGTALLISVYFTWRQRLPVKGRDLLTGLAVGIPNLFSSYFLIAALNSLPATVVYPLYSAGSILLINLGGVILFRERLTSRQLISTALTMLALVMINL